MIQLIANEVIEDYRQRKKEAVALKIDLTKAYDHVDWEFLDYVLEKKYWELSGQAGLEVVYHLFHSQ